MIFKVTESCHDTIGNAKTSTKFALEGYLELESPRLDRETAPRNIRSAIREVIFAISIKGFFFNHGEGTSTQIKLFWSMQEDTASRFF